MDVRIEKLPELRRMSKSWVRTWLRLMIAAAACMAVLCVAGLLWYFEIARNQMVTVQVISGVAVIITGGWLAVHGMTIAGWCRCPACNRASHPVTLLSTKAKRCRGCGFALTEQALAENGVVDQNTQH